MSSRFFEIPSLPREEIKIRKIINNAFKFLNYSDLWNFQKKKKNFFLPFFTPFFYIYPGIFFLQKDKYIAQGFLVVNVMKGGMMNKNKSKPSVRLTTTS